MKSRPRSREKYKDRSTLFLNRHVRRPLQLKLMLALREMI